MSAYLLPLAVALIAAKKIHDRQREEIERAQKAAQRRREEKDRGPGIGRADGPAR